MTRKALVVGIDHYASGNHLAGCVHDARAVATVLRRHANDLPNFDTMLLTATGPDRVITHAELRTATRELFTGEGEVCLFYFAGHGHIEATGGYLVASDDAAGEPGVPIGEVLAWANASRWTNRVIVLDSCHAGIAGDSPDAARVAQIMQGTTILAASTSEQNASEENGAGVFTSLLLDALDGGAADLLGNITPGSVYAHIDQSLGNWESQRPVFKTNVQRFVSLRQVEERVARSALLRLPELFPDATLDLPLDPSFEPRDEGRTAEMPPADPRNTEIFGVLQSLNRVGLLVPTGADHMWNAAMESRACRLTPLGRHYRRLAADGRI